MCLNWVRFERDTLVANCINNETKLECVARGIVEAFGNIEQVAVRI